MKPDFAGSLTALAVLILLTALLGVSEAGRYAFLLIFPYAAVLIFIGGFCCRVVCWAAAPVPFRIPTTCGQQKSLPWIKYASIDNPASGLAAAVRVAGEVLLFRSLFRNSRAELRERRYHFVESRLLWLAAMVFHFALLLIIIRHLRLLLQPVPGFVMSLSTLDGFFQVGVPVFYLSDLLILVSLGYLLLRRLVDSQLRYISQFIDYFVPLLLLAIALSGIVIRYVTRVDIVAVKKLSLGLASFSPFLPEGLSLVFIIHLTLVCILFCIFPFSKLMHMGAVFLSPTRNLANNSRSRRHLNPWNRPVRTHTYPEWEDEFHDKLNMAGIPLDEAGLCLQKN